MHETFPIWHVNALPLFRYATRAHAAVPPTAGPSIVVIAFSPSLSLALAPPLPDIQRVALNDDYRRLHRLHLAT